jgi:hypothetical protein
MSKVARVIRRWQDKEPLPPTSNKYLEWAARIALLSIWSAFWATFVLFVL